MHSFARHLYLFLSACGGNWRNTLYISCREHGLDSPGYLLASDWDGKPVIMAVEQLRHHTGEQIDPGECCGQLAESAFKNIYAQYLLWQFPEDGTDILAALSHYHR